MFDFGIHSVKGWCTRGKVGAMKGMGIEHCIKRMDVLQRSARRERESKVWTLAAAKDP